MATKYKLHPLCEKFPAMPEDEFKELVEDIRRNGQRDPIWVYNNVLLDGKHRLEACEVLKQDPDVRKWTPKHGPEEPQIRAFVLSKNFYRRHMNASQRAIIVAEMVTTKGPGKPALLGINSQLDASEAAEIASVSRKTVNQATDVLQNGSAALVDAVKSGDVSLADAANITDLPKSEQTAAVKDVLKGDEKTVSAASGKKPRKPRKKKPKPEPLPIPEREAGDDATEPEHDETIIDALGVKPLAKLRGVFAKATEFRSIINAIGAIRTRVKKLHSSSAGGWLPMVAIEKHLDELQKGIKFAEPHTECVNCQRKPSDKCKACEGTGWVTEVAYNQTQTREGDEWLKNR